MLTNKYPDKWVAIVDKNVVAFGKGIDEVREIAKNKTGKTRIPVIFVEGEPRVYKD